MPETNGEEWDRLESASALEVLVELTIHGEYNNVLGDGSRTKHSLELRTVAASVFEVSKRKSCSWISSHQFKHNTEFRSQGGNQTGHR